MNQEGMDMSVSRLSEIVNTLEVNVQVALSRRSEFAKISEFTKDHAQEMFDILGEICKLYLTFDYSYWDSTFQASATDSIAAQKVEIVQNFKNKIREDLDPIFFSSGGFLGKDSSAQAARIFTNTSGSTIKDVEH